MTSQPYRQAPDGVRRPVPPAPLQWLTVSLVVVVALYIALPIAMALDREATTQSILVDRPSLSARELEFAIGAALLYSAVLHAVDIVLATWFVIKVRARRRWARVALTIYLVFVTLASYISWTEGPQFFWAVLSTAAVHLVMLALLWIPASSRGYFAPDAAVQRHEEQEVSDAATR